MQGNIAKPEVLVETSHGLFYLDPILDAKILSILKQGGHHQAQDLELYKFFVNKNSIFVDVGAHIGTISIPMARHVKKVMSFEASRSTYLFLCKNIKINKLENIYAVNLGIGAKDELANINTKPVDRGSWFLEKKTKNESGQIVTISTLDKNVKKADFVKIDVEGMELEVLSGGSNLLRKETPILFLEINYAQLRKNGAAPKNIQDFLEKSQYTIYLHLPLFKRRTLYKVRSLSSFVFLFAPKAYLFATERSPVFNIIAIPKWAQIPKELNVKDRNWIAEFLWWKIKNYFIYFIRIFTKTPAKNKCHITA